MLSDFRSNPHDKYVRDQLSDPRLARTFLSKFLDTEIVNALKLDTLFLMRDSYVDEDLKEHFSDLVYVCEMNTGESADVCILLEHKSYLPAWPKLQLLRYLLNAWEAQLKSDKLTHKRNSRLRPVIPVILYHGQERWKDRRLKDYFVEKMPPKFVQFVPEFAYELVDLNTYSSEQIAGMQLGMFEIMVTALQVSRDLEKFAKEFRRVALVMEEYGNPENPDQQITAFFLYLYSTLKTSPDKFFKIIQENMPDTLEKTSLTVYEQIILPFKKQLEEKDQMLKAALAEARRAQERARQEQERVREKNRRFIKIALEQTLPMKQIVEFTQLKEAEIRKIMKSIKVEDSKEEK